MLREGVERIDGADQSWVQLSSEDVLEEANLEQIPHRPRRQGLGSKGAGERIPWELWPRPFWLSLL